MDEIYRILIICGWAAMLWWGISLDRYREKEWKSKLQKYFDFCGVYIGLPVSFVIAGLLLYRSKFEGAEISIFVSLGAILLMVIGSFKRYRKKEWSSNSLKHYDCFVVFAGIPFLVICFMLFLIRYF